MWVKLDDAFADHPKMASAGPLALVIQVRALCYASRHLTDGFIPAGAVHYFLAGFETISVHDGPGTLKQAGGVDWAERMVADGLWDRVSNGYVIHDFLDYNPSKTQVLLDREKTKDRLTRMRRKEAHPKPVGDSDVDTERPYNAVCTPVETPTVTGAVTPFVTPLQREYNAVCNASPAPAPAPAPVPTPEPAPVPLKRKRRVSAVVVQPPADAGEESPIAETWAAYSMAHQDRYGKLPVRNAMVNGQLAQFVKRLGAVVAPQVARFYVFHNRPYYVQKNHTVGPLLVDAESLENQWARNVKTTTREAQSAEQKDNVREQYKRVMASLSEKGVAHG